jgi:Beta/Gamma crystallin
MKSFIKATTAALALGISSLAAAGEVLFFETRDLTGLSIAIRSDVTDLGAYGIATSIQAIDVRSGNWEFCTDREFRGQCVVFGQGVQSNLNNGQGMRVLSAREVRYRYGGAGDAARNTPPRIELYPEIDFRGAGMNHYRDADLRWGVRSLIVHSGTWEICSDSGSRGRCQVFQPGQYRILDGQMMGARSARLLAGPGVPPPVAPPPQRSIDPVAAIAGAVIGGLIGGNQGVAIATPVSPQAIGATGRIHFFPGPGLTGQPLSVVGNVPNFQDFGFNDRAQSIRVESGVWEVCSDSGFRGACRQLAPGDYPALWNSMLDRSISSARMIQAPNVGVMPGVQDGTYPAGTPETPHSVILFADEDFRGETFRANGDLENLRNTSMNDRAGSIFIRQGRWEFCTDSRSRGTCLTLGPGSYGRLQYPMDRAISSFRRVQ